MMYRGRIFVLIVTTLVVLESILEVVPGLASDDMIRKDQWFLAYLNVAAAQRISNGTGITVAVIDTGVDASHPDLKGNVLKGIDLSGGSSAALDGQRDDDGHGTFIAGLIAAHGHGVSSSYGALGIAPEAKILPIKYTDSVGEDGGIERGIRWAITHNVQVICIASGVASDPGLSQAIGAAEAADIVIVAAAGNAPNAQSISYPAAYSGVLAAVGTDKDGTHASISATGPHAGLAAPATEIVSTYTKHEYIGGNGTSNSAAIIAGAAALVRSRFPRLSAAEVVHRLEATAIDKGPPGFDDEYGYGELNIVGALTDNVPPLSTPSSIASGSVRPHPDLSTTASAGDAPHHGIPWQPISAGAIAILVVLAAWLAVRRGSRA